MALFAEAYLGGAGSLWTSEDCKVRHVTLQGLTEINNYARLFVGNSTSDSPVATEL